MQGGMLDGLTQPDQRGVLAKMVRRSYRRGDTLFHEGDPGDTLHVIVKGHVAVRTSTSQGDVVTLAVLGPGSSFGEQALLTEDAARTASIVALDPVETRSLHRNDFNDLRTRHPSIERFLVDMLAAQVRRLSDQVRDAFHLSADQRVVRRLADIVTTYRGDTVGPVDIPVKQEDLATMAGTTRPTANRVLKQLENDGIITLSRSHVTVLDTELLARRAR